MQTPNNPKLIGIILRFVWGLFLFTLYASTVSVFIWTLGHLMFAYMEYNAPVVSPKSLILFFISTGAGVRITQFLWGD